MRALAIISLLFVLALVSVSAYLRLDNSGIGCADWPACYGRIGARKPKHGPLAVPTNAWHSKQKSRCHGRRPRTD